MSWTVKRHEISASFPREWRAATRTPDARLRLAINQYIPAYISKETTLDGALTVVLAHANGFHKEMYEPMLETILEKAKDSGLLIRSVWAIDAAHQGESGVINEKELGDEPSWNDYARDIMHMVSVFREQMPEPRIGLGHSMGAQSILQSALWNRSIFNAVIAMEPVVRPGSDAAFPTQFNPAALSQKRQDIWPDRASAEAFFKSRPFYKAWDPRCLDIHLKYGLRELPTFTYPTAKGVTLQTTKHQEVWTFCRAMPDDKDGVNRPEPGQTFQDLPRMPVPLYYVFGGDSFICTEDDRALKKKQNPDSEQAVIEGAGHLLAYEKPVETGDVIAKILIKEVSKWKPDYFKDWSRPRDAIISDDFRRRMMSRL